METFVNKGKDKKGNVVLSMDNEEYIKGAPEGFKESSDYLKDQNEINKKKAVEAALEIFKEDKEVKQVIARIPFGKSKLDALSLTIKRETAKTPMNPNGNPTVQQKPKSSLLGANTHLKEMKDLLKASL